MGARRGAPRCKTSACLPGAQGPELAHITFFLYFTHCLASVYVSGIVSYAIAVILSRCGPSECVVVALSGLSPFLTHFFHAVKYFAQKAHIVERYNAEQRERYASAVMLANSEHN